MAERARPPIGSKALRVEQARLSRFFEPIAKHRKALDLAIDENLGRRGSFSTNCGLMESLKDSLRCGCGTKARQIRETALWESPASRAIERVDQWGGIVTPAS